MAGVGLLLGYVGYATISWGYKAITNQDQAPFVRQIFPFAK